MMDAFQSALALIRSARTLAQSVSTPLIITHDCCDLVSTLRQLELCLRTISYTEMEWERGNNREGRRSTTEGNAEWEADGGRGSEEERGMEWNWGWMWKCEERYWRRTNLGLVFCSGSNSVCGGVAGNVVHSGRWEELDQNWKQDTWTCRCWSSLRGRRTRGSLFWVRQITRRFHRFKSTCSDVWKVKVTRTTSMLHGTDSLELWVLSVVIQHSFFFFFLNSHCIKYKIYLQGFGPVRPALVFQFL